MGLWWALVRLYMGKQWAEYEVRWAGQFASTIIEHYRQQANNEFAQRKERTQS